MQGHRARQAMLGQGLWATLLLLVLPATANASTQKVEELLKCFSGRDCLAEPTTWEHFTQDRPSCLSVARVWWSSKPPGLPVTLVTQLSAERLPQVRAQCATWAGPLAAALYVPLLNPDGSKLSAENAKKLQELIQLATDLVNESEAVGSGSDTAAGQGMEGGLPRGSCQLRLMLVYEVFHTTKPTSLYPVNSLRNLARLMADTDLITNIDVDMVPSVSISTTLQDPALLAQYRDGCKAGKVYIWPALDTRCHGKRYADAVATFSKDKVAAMLVGRDRCVGQMRGNKAPLSHNATDFRRWVHAKETYRVVYEETFEPWFLTWRWKTPWFDYRYRGYGKNKIVQSAHMNATGTPFMVSPHGFIIHRPHAESKARVQFLKVKFSKKDMDQVRGTLYEHIDSLWQDTRRELAAGSYRARVEEPFTRCVGALSWWRQPAR